ncbi:MAG: PorV/PorQ family protein [Methanococcaceae archaeon]
MKKRITYSIILAFIFISISFAQELETNVSKRGTTAAPFLKISQGARASGMGSAFVAVADDPSAIYWNCAGLARLQKNGVVFDHTQWIADINYLFMGASIHLGDYGSFGLSFISSNYGDMKVTTIDEPNGTGEVFNASDLAVSVAYALNLTDNFSIGFNPKVVYQGIWKMSSFAMAMDMGVLYNTPFKGVTLGMSITNFGQKMQLSGKSNLILYDQDESSTGNNDKIPASLNTDNWDLPLGFKFGISYTPFNSEAHKLVLAMDASHPNDNYESINMGAEYAFNQIFFLRGGFKSLFLEKTEESFTLGAGVKQNLLGNINIYLDYAYASFGRLSSIQKFSFGINF